MLMLFLINVNVNFMLIKNSKNIKGIKGINTFFILLTEMIVLSFFKKSSIKELLNAINYFSSFPGLKPNLSKCEVAGKDAPKGVKVAIKVLIILN